MPIVQRCFIEIAVPGEEIGSRLALPSTFSQWSLVHENDRTRCIHSGVRRNAGIFSKLDNRE